MSNRISSNWNTYNSDSANFFNKIFFLDLMALAYEKLLKRASFKKPISIIELGCGTGYTSYRISRMIPTKKITLVDSNAHMINIAKRTFLNVACKKEFIQKDFFKLNLKQKYDLVHSGGVVEHFNDDKRKKLINLHAELVAPDGYCIIYAPTPTFSYRLVRRISEMLGLWNFPDEVPIRKTQLIREVQEAGLTVLGSNYFWRLFLTEVGVLAKKPKDWSKL